MCEDLKAELEIVIQLRRIDVELRIVEKIDLAQARLGRGLEDIPRVTHPVDVADLVAVVGRDRQLRDAEFFQDELDDDLGIEMKILRVPLERNLRQRAGRVEPVAGMKLREPGAEHPVLEIGQDLVADPFVERHAAGAGGAFVDHARTEDGFGFAVDQRPEEGGKFFRRVLAIAMDERDDVEAVIDGVAVAELLVAAVALVLRGAQDGDLKSRMFLLVTQPVEESPVARGIVDDQHLDAVLVQRGRDAAEHFLDRRLRVVGDDEDEDAFPAQIDARGKLGQ